jgi:threonine dehydratase
MPVPANAHLNHRLSLAAIAAASGRIDPIFLLSPQYDCEPLSAALGCALTLKLETANPIRSFKGRGASYLIRSMAATAAKADAPLVGASAGNWGQALAYTCRKAGQRLILFASVNANPMKIERMRSLGTDVRLVGEDFDAAKMEAEAFAVASGLRMVADGLDPEASIGAATIGVELLASGQVYEAVLVPLGNGAMLTGIARWVKAVAPSTAVYGVSATGADAMEKSWRTGTIVRPASIDTIADGIGVRVPIPEAVEDMRGIVDDVLLVEDRDIIAAMRMLHRDAGLLSEPSGAAGVAAILAHGNRFRGQRVAAVICGSNITEAQIRLWLT